MCPLVLCLLVRAYYHRRINIKNIRVSYDAPATTTSILMQSSILIADGVSIISTLAVRFVGRYIPHLLGPKGDNNAF